MPVGDPDVDDASMVRHGMAFGSTLGLPRRDQLGGWRRVMTTRRLATSGALPTRRDVCNDHTNERFTAAYARQIVGGCAVNAGPTEVWVIRPSICVWQALARVERPDHFEGRGPETWTSPRGQSLCNPSRGRIAVAPRRERQSGDYGAGESTADQPMSRVASGATSAVA